MAGVQAVRADILHHDNSRFGGRFEPLVERVEADALTSLGGAIDSTGERITNGGRQFGKHAADIVSDITCYTRTYFECFDGVRDRWAINAPQSAKLFKTEPGYHMLCFSFHDSSKRCSSLILSHLPARESSQHPARSELPRGRALRQS